MCVDRDTQRIGFANDSFGNDAVDYPARLRRGDFTDGEPWNIVRIGEAGDTTETILEGRNFGNNADYPAINVWYPSQTPIDVFFIQASINDVFRVGVGSDPQANCDEIFARMMQIADVAFANGTPKVVLFTPPPVNAFPGWATQGRPRQATWDLLTAKIKNLNGANGLCHIDIQPVLDTDGNGAIDADITVDNLHPTGTTGQIRLSTFINEFLTKAC